MRAILRKIAMKVSQIFTVVLGLHVLIITVLLVQPGCQKRPDSIARTAHPTGSPQTQVADVQTPGLDPAESPGGTPDRRLPPTRPTWNMNTGGQTEVINGYDVETVEVIEESGTATTTESPTTSVASTYTVQRGDNLTRIAQQHGVSLNELLAANNLTRDAVIRVGQVITIPAGGSDAPVPSAPGTTASVASGTTYTVVSGDSLSRIASRHGVTVTALRSVNNLQGDLIRVGQTLSIPDGASRTSATAASPAPSAPSAPVPNAAGEITYEVRSGDTLGAIANRYDVTVSELMTRNNIADPRRLRAGQKLIIPTDLQPVAPAPTVRTTETRDTATPAPRPATTPTVQVEEQEEVVEVQEVDLFDNLDAIPIVPVQSE